MSVMIPQDMEALREAARLHIARIEALRQALMERGAMSPWAEPRWANETLQAALAAVDAVGVRT